jgi:hypothetical protein
MSLSNKNRIYGLIFGGIISDTMGAIVSYNPNIKVEKPSDSESISIKEGYWTEPTTLWLNTFSTETGMISVTGIYSKSNTVQNPILSKILQSSALTLLNINDFTSQLQSCYDLGSDSLEKDLCKLWTGIMDITLHGGNKKTILNQSNYVNIDYDKDLNKIFPGNEDNMDSIELQCLRDVLITFKTTNSFTEGLVLIVNHSPRPKWSATIYGQLAGAYYGLTDIPEDWLSNLQASDQILEIINSYFQKMST